MWPTTEKCLECIKNAMIVPATARWRMKKFIRDFLLLAQPRDKITMAFPRIITKSRL